MKARNTNAIVEFIFKGLELPCLVLAQKAFRTLTTREGGTVKRPNNPMSPQYLKFMKPILWDQWPPLMNVPYILKTTPGNTLMVDDNSAKTFLTPWATKSFAPLGRSRRSRTNF